MTDRKLNCPQCGKTFMPWRGKTYCSEKCRKRAENLRAGRVRGDEGPTLPDDQKVEKNDAQNQVDTRAFRGDGPFEWIACNEVTRKLLRVGSPDAVAWAMYIEPIEGYTYGGWYGRVGKEMSFGPTTQLRAKLAVEAFLRGEPFKKRTFVARDLLDANQREVEGG
jgi:hypothetical protein